MLSATGDKQTHGVMERVSFITCLFKSPISKQFLSAELYVYSHEKKCPSCLKSRVNGIQTNLWNYHIYMERNSPNFHQVKYPGFCRKCVGRLKRFIMITWIWDSSRIRNIIPILWFFLLILLFVFSQPESWKYGVKLKKCLSLWYLIKKLGD